MNEHVEGNWWSNNAGRYAERVFVEMLLHGGLRCDASIVVDNWGNRGRVEQKRATHPASQQASHPAAQRTAAKTNGFRFLISAPCVRRVGTRRQGAPLFGKWMSVCI
jgi:hypothetical protein